MNENTTFASFKMEPADHTMTDSFEDTINISHHTTNITGFAEDRPHQNSLLNAGLITVSSISLTCCLIFLRIITKCKRLTSPIKYLSKNFVVSFMFLDLTIWLHSIAMLLWGRTYLYDLIFDSRVFFASIGSAVLWSSLVALTYERVLAVVQPFTYYKYTSKTKVTLFICVMWTVNILVPTVILIVSALRFCKFSGFYSCEVYNLFNPFRKCFLGFLTLYGTLIVIGYIKIMSIILKQQNNISIQMSNQNFTASLGSNLKATKTIAAIVLSFIILQSPLFLHSFIFEIQPRLKQQSWRMLFQGLDYISLQLLMYTSLYLYIWMVKECKMQFYLLISKCCKNFEQKANDMRIDVLDIVVYDRRAAGNLMTWYCFL